MLKVGLLFSQKWSEDWVEFYSVFQASCDFEIACLKG